MLSTRHVAVFSRHLKSHLLWQDHDSYFLACNRHPWSEEGEREVLRTCIQLYAEAEGQSVALKMQHFPLGTESAKKSHTHSVNHGEKEIFTILPLLWDMSLTTRILKDFSFKILILYYLFGKKSGKALEIYQVTYMFILRICKTSCCFKKMNVGSCGQCFAGSHLLSKKPQSLLLHFPSSLLYTVKKKKSTIIFSSMAHLYSFFIMYNIELFHPIMTARTVTSKPELLFYWEK